MNFCPNCGSKVEDTNYCQNCGFNLKEYTQKLPESNSPIYNQHFASRNSGTDSSVLNTMNQHNNEKHKKHLDKAYHPPVLPKRIEKMIASGKSYSSCVKELKNISQYSDMSSKDLKILVSTVGTRIMAENSIRDMEKIHQYYKISCLSDSCPICKKASKMRYRIKDRKAGVNFPPFHDGCRCTFTIVEPKDWSRWISDYKKK